MIGRRVVRSTRSSLESSVEVLPPEKNAAPSKSRELPSHQPAEFQRQYSVTSSIGRRLTECANALRKQKDETATRPREGYAPSSSNTTTHAEENSGEDDNEQEDLPNGVELLDLEEFESFDDRPVPKCESVTPKLTRRDVESIQDLKTIEFLVRNSQTLSRYMNMATSPQGLSSAASSNAFEFEDLTFLTTINKAQFVSMRPPSADWYGSESAVTPSNGSNYLGTPGKSTGLADIDDEDEDDEEEEGLETLSEESEHCLESSFPNVHQSLDSKVAKELHRNELPLGSKGEIRKGPNSFFDKASIEAGVEQQKPKKSLFSKPPRNPSGYSNLKPKVIPEEQDKQIHALLENSRYDGTESIQLQDGEGFSVSSEQQSRMNEIHNKLKLLRPEIQCWDSLFNPGLDITTAEKADDATSSAFAGSQKKSARDDKLTAKGLLQKEQKRKANQWLVQARLQRAERERLSTINSKLQELYQHENYINEGGLTSDQLNQLLESCRKEQQRVPCEPYNSNTCNIVCISPHAPAPLQSDLPRFLEESEEADLSSRIAEAQRKHAMRSASRFDAEEEFLTLSNSIAGLGNMDDQLFSVSEATLTDFLPTTTSTPAIV